MRVHLGCACTHLPGWLNVDSDPRVSADVYADPFEFVARHGPDIDELYLGHLLEDLVLDDALALLRLIGARTVSGTPVTAAAVDVRAACAAFASGEVDSQLFNCSLVHTSSAGRAQRWSYDGAALVRLFEDADLNRVAAVDAAALPDAATMDAAVQSKRCAAKGFVGAAPAAPGGLPERMSNSNPARHPVTETAESALLDELQRCRTELSSLRSREQHARTQAASAERLARDLADTRTALEQLERSITYRVAHRGSLVARRLLPAGSARRRMAASVLRAASPRDGKGT